ncbi:MAG: carbon monoxide dehydrogenase, partial [bacterium]|nr:carbon monoxide dehydrogenase [bacterium]
AKDDGISTAFERSSLIKPCPFGSQGLCCKNCTMGPCRITDKTPKGVCGVNGATIVARNFIRMIAAGAVAHSDLIWIQ